jgi:hypothetical protein
MFDAFFDMFVFFFVPVSNELEDLAVEDVLWVFIL